MTGHRRSGIALILVISIIGLMGITLGYLAYSCRLMLIQTDLEYLKEVDRNLALSGLAWANHQHSEPGTQNSVPKAEATGLDVNEVAGRGARLSVVIADGNDKTATVRIQTHVPSARHALNRSRTFEVQRP